jgi:hypothetical protein
MPEARKEYQHKIQSLQIFENTMLNSLSKINSIKQKLAPSTTTSSVDLLADPRRRSSYNNSALNIASKN